MKALLATRGGGGGAWFAGRGGNGGGGGRASDPYNEFPDDFDYDAEEEDVEGTGLFWPDEDSASEEGAVEASQDSLGRDLEEEDAGEQEEEQEEGRQERRRTDRLSSVGFGKDRGGGGGGGRGERFSEGYTSELGRCGHPTVLCLRLLASLRHPLFENFL